MAVDLFVRLQSPFLTDGIKTASLKSWLANYATSYARAATAQRSRRARIIVASHVMSKATFVVASVLAYVWTQDTAGVNLGFARIPCDA